MVTSASTRRRNMAWLLALVTMVSALYVLRNTFTASGPSDWTIPAWSLTLAAVWFVGGFGLIAINDAVPRRPRQERTRACIEAFLLGVTLAVACFVGALVLLEFEWTADPIRNAVNLADTSSAFVVFAVAFIAGSAEEVFFRLGLADLLHGISRWVVPTISYTVVTLVSGNIGLVAVAPALALCCTFIRERSGWWFTPLIVHGLWSIAMVGVFPMVVGA